MQSPLFENMAITSSERFTLQNPHILRVALDRQAAPELLARKGAMIAFTGAVDFDGYMPTQGEMRAAAYGAEFMSLMRCTGTGVVYLANQAQSIHLVALANEGIIVDNDSVLALDPGLTWSPVAIDAEARLSGPGSNGLLIGGTGMIALTTPGTPLVMKVGPRSEVFVDADAVVAWSSNLTTRLEAQTVSSRVWRRRGQTGEGWMLSFIGEGWVLVQSTEVSPPDMVQHQGGPLGMGRQGYQNNSWGGPGGPHGPVQHPPQGYPQQGHPGYPPPGPQGYPPQGPPGYPPQGPPRR
ncbi:AIM24 family protein [Yinghuangia soli]|uniref:AIM24 family protein n=1 Tax=Yinghuangia soli TaxID=2908204 RepID=A0AA41PYP6_9ACTN|nr:AIM24 family protein [Yinghuangia soli]MCF2527601.1 AIM24 family protein [Yinghuangia soli]